MNFTHYLLFVMLLIFFLFYVIEIKEVTYPVFWFATLRIVLLFDVMRLEFNLDVITCLKLHYMRSFKYVDSLWEIYKIILTTLK